MTIILGDKNTASRKPTKIFKNQELSFVFAQMNAAHCISGQNKWLEAGDYSACTPRTGQVAGGRLRRSLEDAAEPLLFRV